MSETPEPSADFDRIARAFHESYERQAPIYSYSTREETAVPWEQVPWSNRSLMQAVVADLIAQGVIIPGAQIDGRDS